MQRWQLAGLLTALWLTGCGAATTPVVSGPHSPKAWQAVVVQHAETVRAMTATLTVSPVGPGSLAPLSAQVVTDGTNLKESILTANGQTITVIRAPGHILIYQSGSGVVAEPSSWAPLGYGLSWLTNDFSGFLHAVRFTKVRATATRLTADWQGKVPAPASGTASGVLTYNLVTHTPLGLQARWSGGAIRIAVTHFNPAPTLSPKAFQYEPPRNTMPVNASASAMDSLNTVQERLGYTLLVPSTKADLSLNEVSVAKSSSYGPEAILEFTGAEGNPVLVTEYQGRSRSGLPATAFNTQLAGHSVTEVTLSDGVEVTLSENGVTVVAEGTTADLTALVENLVPLTTVP
jgi:hypothetical protein